MSYTVCIAPSGKSFEIEANEKILDAALRNGIALPYGCRHGACRSCRGRVVAGRFDYPDGPPKASTPFDAAQRFALLCAARARSDLSIEIEELDTDQPIEVRTLPCRVVAKRHLAHDVVALTLELPTAERLRFLAGQYVEVVMRDGRRRAFSLANAPRDDNRLELHIRHVPEGSFSGYAFSHLKERAILRIHGPLGSFYLRKNSERPVILMAGGTGFAPIRSIVEDALGNGFRAPMHLYWGVRARRDLYQHDLALAWAESHGSFRYTPVLSEPAPEDAWDGRRGLVHAAVLEDYTDLSGHVAYMSGPPAMVEAGRSSFVDRGLDPIDVHSDAFDYAYETGYDATG